MSETEELQRRVAAAERHLAERNLETRLERLRPPVSPLKNFNAEIANNRAIDRAALTLAAEKLLGADAKAERAMRSTKSFTPEEAALLKQAADAGCLKDGRLVQVEIVDPYSNARRIEFYGDDEGATWHVFANPLRIGKFATPNKATMGAPPRSTTAWYEGY